MEPTVCEPARQSRLHGHRHFRKIALHHMALLVLTQDVALLNSNSVARAVQPLLNDPEQIVRDQAENLLTELRKGPR